MSKWVWRCPEYSLEAFDKQKILSFEWSPPWHLYILLLTYLLAFYLAYLLAYLLTSYLAFYLANLLNFIWQTFWTLSGIPCSILSGTSELILAGISSGILSGISFGRHISIHSSWHIFRHSIWPLRSSGARWARKVPGWGPAVLTGLGRSLIEVQRCPLRSEPCSWGPALPTQIGSRQLRSSDAHCARKLAKRLATSWQGRSRQLRSSSAHCARKLAKRLATSWQGGSGRGSWCRHGGGEGGGGGGRTALTKSNNPHLAGGGKHIEMIDGFVKGLFCDFIHGFII